MDNKNIDKPKLSDEDKFKELNIQYMTCLNEAYDKFFDNKEVDLENSCKDIKENLMSVGNFYKDMKYELDSYKTSSKK